MRALIVLNLRLFYSFALCASGKAVHPNAWAGSAPSLYSQTSIRYVPNCRLLNELRGCDFLALAISTALISDQ